MRTYNLISNITNGAGLQKDTELLARMIEAAGHKATRSMFNATVPSYKHHDVNIFIEVVNHGHFPYAKENWLIPNSEWWGVCWESLVPRFNRVLCKTHDCYEIWKRKVGDRAIFTGFEANDFYRPEIVRKPTFLHLAGKSETKNTAVVMEAWRTHNIPYPLLVSAFKPGIVRMCQGVPNVRQIERLTDAETITALNECQFHIMPSKYEGYGHAIHEALGCKGIVITTGAPPMSEFAGIDPQLLVPVEKRMPRPPLTYFYEVSAVALAGIVYKAAHMTPQQIARAGETARNGFLSERELFRKTFEELIRG